jgi:hypothetical protein
MAPFPKQKQAQQESFLKSLKNASQEEKAKIALANSGFVSAVRNNRRSISINFS